MAAHQGDGGQGKSGAPAFITKVGNLWAFLGT